MQGDELVMNWTTCNETHTHTALVTRPNGSVITRTRVPQRGVMKEHRPCLLMLLLGELMPVSYILYDIYIYEAT